MTPQETQQRIILRVLSTDTCTLEKGSEKLSWYFTVLGWPHLPACKKVPTPPSFYTDLISLISFRRHLLVLLWLFTSNYKVQGTKACQGKQKDCHSFSPDPPDLPLWTAYSCYISLWTVRRYCIFKRAQPASSGCQPSMCMFILNPPANPKT